MIVLQETTLGGEYSRVRAKMRCVRLELPPKLANARLAVELSQLSIAVTPALIATPPAISHTNRTAASVSGRMPALRIAET